MLPADALATYGLLTASIVALWFPPRPGLRGWVSQLWSALFLVSAVVGLWAGLIELLALPFIAAFALYAYILGYAPPWTHQHVAAIVGVIVFSAMFMAHLAPGFNNYKAISAVTFSRGASAYTQYFNYDKALIGLVLIAFTVPVCRDPAGWRAVLRRGIPWSLGVSGVVVLLALVTGYVRFDPKFPSELFLWAWINLFFTCIPEEALFRGLVQQGLQERLAGRRRGHVIALAVASTLFGVAHFAGGLLYVFLATVAGFGYGGIYQRTGAIEASIVTHFMLNTQHFLLFTYPALK